VGWLIETPTSLDCSELVAKKNAAGETNDFNREFSYCDDSSPLLTFADADFIEHARIDIPDLLAEVHRLRALVDGES
jgi:hypothetical protein